MLLVSRFLPCPLGVLLPSSPAWKHAPSPSVFTAMDSGPYPAEITALFCEHPCPEHLPKQSSMGGEPKDGQVLRIRDGKKWRQAPCPNTAFSQSHYLPVRTFGSEPRRRHCPASCSIMHGYKMAVRALAAQPAWASHHEKIKKNKLLCMPIPAPGWPDPALLPLASPLLVSIQPPPSVNLSPFAE